MAASILIYVFVQIKLSLASRYLLVPSCSTYFSRLLSNFLLTSEMIQTFAYFIITLLNTFYISIQTISILLSKALPFYPSNQKFFISKEINFHSRFISVFQWS